MTPPERPVDIAKGRNPVPDFQIPVKPRAPTINPIGREKPSCPDTPPGSEKSAVDKQRLGRLKNDDDAPSGYVEPVYVSIPTLSSPHFLTYVRIFDFALNTRARGLSVGLRAPIVGDCAKSYLPSMRNISQHTYLDFLKRILIS